MKYLSLLLLGSSLVAGAKTKAGEGEANAGSTASSSSGNGQVAQGSSNGQMQAGGIVQGGMNAGSTGATQSQSQAATPAGVAFGQAVSAANVPAGQNPFEALGNSTSNNAQFPQLNDNQKMGLQMAVTLWAQDTATVSTALDTLGNTQMSEQDFRDVADMAYMAEVNELMQKNFIDALLGTMPQLQAASTSLGNGSFAIVVDQLREMRIRGPGNATFVQAAVQGMNNLRCRQVLLAIDTYLQTANQAAGNNSFVSSVRPPACTSLYAQTADTLPTGSTTNATNGFPTASQLISQFNQAPRFMISNIVAFSKTSGSDNTPALGSQFSTNAPFTNTSSLSGQLLAFNGQPVQTNGDAANIKANPLNGVLFANQVGAQANNTGSANTGTNSGNGNANQGATGTGATGATGATGQTGKGEAGAGKAGAGKAGANANKGAARAFQA